MIVNLRVLDGPLTGKDFEFDLQEGAEVRIGRDPARCRFVLPADYPTVSRQHCVLRAVLGRVRLQLNKENPVFVGQRQGWDDSVVQNGAELRLGPNGPRLLMTIKDPDAAFGPRSTVVLGRGYVPLEQVVQEQTQRTAEELRGHRTRIWLVAALLGAAAAVGLWLSIETREVTGKLIATTLSEQQRASVLELVDRSSRPVPDLGAVVRTASQSIYCVLRREGETWRHVGTAWVFDREAGQVATNSHVAAEFAPGRTFLRAQGHASEDIPIASVRVHPGFDRYTQLCLKYGPALQIDGGSASKTVAACDVALLQIDSEHRADLATALPVRGTADLELVGTGTPCASVGFPAEGLAFNVDRPQSRSHIGHVIAVSDFFMAPAPAGSAQLVHTDLPVTGGASGSPVLDQQGRVFGIINAGSFTLGMEGRRIPIAGTTYAQRIDLLREIVLDDAADQTAREKTWETAFTAMVANARKSLEQVLIERFRAWVAPTRKDLPVEVVARAQTALAWDGRVASSEFSYAVPAKARYLFCAMSEDMEDIDAVALLPDGRRLIDNSPDWYPCLDVAAGESDVVRFVVLRPANKPVPVSIIVLQAGQ
ncbi:MAG TPA: trypsin-like peptidase domain-containing protein [Planctomycetota bacterium]|nr:trypsin-like peptidase domain-containing protein [Planctomycetota bacterium]